MVSSRSQFTAQSAKSPSEIESVTNVGELRIVVVIGATVTELRNPMAEERVKINAGRLPSGEGKSHHQTSPRFTASMRPNLHRGLEGSPTGHSQRILR